MIHHACNHYTVSLGVPAYDEKRMQDGSAVSAFLLETGIDWTRYNRPVVLYLDSHNDSHRSSLGTLVRNNIRDFYLPAIIASNQNGILVLHLNVIQQQQQEWGVGAIANACGLFATTFLAYIITPRTRKTATRRRRSQRNVHSTKYDLLIRKWIAHESRDSDPAHPWPCISILLHPPTSI